MNNIDTRLELDDLMTKIIGITQDTVYLLMQGWGDVISVYVAYYSIAKREQNTSKIKCNIPELIARLKMSESRVTKARAYLNEKWLIADITEKDDDNKITGWRVKINYQPISSEAFLNAGDKNLKTMYGQFVSLTPIEYQKLCMEYGAPQTNTFIKDLDVHIGSKWVKYNSHYFTLLSWFRRKGVTPNSERKLIKSIP